MIKKNIFLLLTIIFFGYISGCSKTEKNSDLTQNSEVRAILVEGTGTYSRKISTNSELAQKFFDQGLRYAWAFHFPESIASYQQAAIHDPKSSNDLLGNGTCNRSESKQPILWHAR